MPSHQDRISKQYSDLCSKCLIRNNYEWDNEAKWPWLCDVCTWLKYLEEKAIHKLPTSIIERMTPEERQKIAYTP